MPDASLHPASLFDLISDRLPPGSVLHCEHEELRAHLGSQGWTLSDHSDVDAVVLLSGEIAAAGVRASGVVDAAVKRCRPGGLVVAAVPSTLYLALTGRGQDDTPALASAEFEHLLAERGMTVELMAAPGATARLAARDFAGRADLDSDRTPGLLDAGPVLLAVARTARSAADRSTAFFASISTKIVSASTMCFDEDNRLLIVFDSFKGCWTLPGGLVDAAESPRDAAVRETLEEGGVEVEAGDLLGVFAHDHPDRINLIYGVRPTHPVADPMPLHDHEIGEVRWASVDDALSTLAPYMARKVRRCLQAPGETTFY